jgi:hypothetical protein
MQVSLTPLCAPLGLYPSGDLGLFTYYTTQKRRVVRFLTTKPLKPASSAQTRQRNLWGAIALQWSSLPQTTRDAWSRVAEGARLKVTAFNLYIHVYSRRDFECLRTVARIAGIDYASLV